jgi:DNA-binding GntR family transcriptional regulator
VNKQERTYAILRDRIHAGAYPPLAKLNIDALARELGVSPIPVREALRRLEAQGWVRFTANVGAVVSPVDETTWDQEMSALAILEGAATAAAAPHLTPAGIARLRDLNKRMTTQDDPAQFSALNRELHDSITSRCGNDYLLELLGQTHDRLDRVRSTMFAYLPDRTSAAAHEHEHLIDLLEHGDAAAIEGYARWHKLQTIAAYRARTGGRR